MNAKFKKVHTTIEGARESLWECSFARVDSLLAKELKDVLSFDNGEYRFSKVIIVQDISGVNLSASRAVVDVEALG